jgi:hypothetical protein
MRSRSLRRCRIGELCLPALIGDFVSKDLVIAIAKSGYCSLQAWNAAGTPWAHQSHGGYGISCLRNRKVKHILLGYIDGSTYADTFSEGTHAKYHYMICGVQGELFLRSMYLNPQKLLGIGDFTRGLVNDPPRTLWTRQLKVSGLFIISPYARQIVTRFIVRRCIEHFHTLQTWRSDMHRYRYWGCPVNLYPIS